jgi:hypothetical protein
VAMMNNITANMKVLQEKMDAEDDVLTSELIFSSTFSKGLRGIKREQEEKNMQLMSQLDFGENKGATDWNVNAVQDEDDL